MLNVSSNPINTFLAFWAETFASKTESDLDDRIIGFIAKVTDVIGIAICLILILGVWGVEIGPFLASLGIAGIAIAFALQSTLHSKELYLNKERNYDVTRHQPENH